MKIYLQVPTFSIKPKIWLFHVTIIASIDFISAVNIRSTSYIISSFRYKCWHYFKQVTVSYPNNFFIDNRYVNAIFILCYIIHNINIEKDNYKLAQKKDY